MWLCVYRKLIFLLKCKVWTLIGAVTKVCDGILYITGNLIKIKSLIRSDKFGVATSNFSERIKDLLSIRLILWDTLYKQTKQLLFTEVRQMSLWSPTNTRNSTHICGRLRPASTSTPWNLNISGTNQ